MHMHIEFSTKSYLHGVKAIQRGRAVDSAAGKA